MSDPALAAAALPIEFAMTPDPRLIDVFDSAGEPYRKAFSTFLAHTDQKANAMVWLEREIEALPRRGTFIDAGAGNGKLTQILQERFAKTIAIEPNPSLRADLIAACPHATALGEIISRAEPPAPGDFVLCSHVFYYIDRSEWAATLRRLASWLAPGGVGAIALQHHGTDCMRMLHHFTGLRFDLSSVAEGFAQESADEFDVRHDLVEAHITTNALEPAYEIAVFMLNLIPLPSPPTRDDVRGYVARHFAQPDGRYRFSCHQQFVRVQRRGTAH